MYWENQPELPSDKGSNRSRGATRDICRDPHWLSDYQNINTEMIDQLKLKL